jgi:hypothetical protein
MGLLEREPALEALQGALGEAAHGEGRVAHCYRHVLAHQS